MGSLAQTIKDICFCFKTQQEMIRILRDRIDDLNERISKLEAQNDKNK